MIKSLALALTILLAFQTQAAPKKPSSKIPEKREFPLNPAVSPCEDFHKYVCSEAEASFKLRDDRSIHTFSFSDSQERILEEKKAFMKKLPTEKDLSARSMQLKDLYLSCMNGPQKARSEKAEVERMKKEIGKIETVRELVQYSNKALPIGDQLFTNLYGNNNQDDSNKVDALLMSKFMYLPDHKYYEDPKLMADYQKLLTQFFQAIDPKIKKKVAKEKATALIDLQKEFIKTYPIASARRQRWSEKRISTQADLIKKYPVLQLQDVFSHLTPETLVSMPIPETFDFEAKQLDVLPLQTWKDLYLFNSLYDVLDDGYQKFYKTRFAFNQKYFGGPTRRPDRQERCTSLVTEHFTKELDAALIDRLFPNFDETKIHEVGKRIRVSILEGIKTNNWLSKEAKKEATNKIETARLQLVKPHNDREWDFVPQRTYSQTDFNKNMQTYNGAQWEKNLKELHEPANKDAWGMGPLTINAYYSPSENKFVLPMGILQYPFYNKDGDIIENLGAVGAVIGHELGHGVDDQGSKFDSKGGLRQWMTMKDLAEFSRRGEKMIDQFNKIGHDGKLTLGENAADLVGLSFAYHAAFPKNEGKLEDKKKFFVAYARVWCSVVRPDFAAMLLKSDPHSAGFARINEQMKHQKGFAEAYSCKPGDKMTLPESEIIKIW